MHNTRPACPAAALDQSVCAVSTSWVTSSFDQNRWEGVPVCTRGRVKSGGGGVTGDVPPCNARISCHQAAGDCLLEGGRCPNLWLCAAVTPVGPLFLQRQHMYLLSSAWCGRRLACRHRHPGMRTREMNLSGLRGRQPASGEFAGVVCGWGGLWARDHSSHECCWWRWCVGGSK